MLWTYAVILTHNKGNNAYVLYLCFLFTVFALPVIFADSANSSDMYFEQCFSTLSTKSKRCPCTVKGQVVLSTELWRLAVEFKLKVLNVAEKILRLFCFLDLWNEKRVTFCVLAIVLFLYRWKMLCKSYYGFLVAPALWTIVPPSLCQSTVYADSVRLGGGGCCWVLLETIFCRCLTLCISPDSDHPNRKPRREGGLGQITLCRKVPLQVNLFRWRHFALLSISLIFLRMGRIEARVYAWCGVLTYTK